MTKASVEELVKAVRPRYVKGSRGEKTSILDEFVAVTGDHRKVAIRRLRGAKRRKGTKRKGRPPVYTPAVVTALWQVWEICGRISSKRLAPFPSEAMAVLEREGEIRFPTEIGDRLIWMSPASIDRLLGPHRDRQRKGRCTTKPGTLLRSQIPARTFADWTDTVPGFLEIDLGSHCAQTPAGEFVHTLTAMDVSSGWCEPVALKNRGQETVQAVLEQMRAHLPFPLLGIDSDNDAAFLNWSVKGTVTRTRSRSPVVVRTRKTTKNT